MRACNIAHVHQKQLDTKRQKAHTIMTSFIHARTGARRRRDVDTRATMRDDALVTFTSLCDARVRPARRTGDAQTTNDDGVDVVR